MKKWLLLLLICQPAYAAPWKLVITNAGNVGATVFDIETTHSCIQRHLCNEANPFMSSNRAGSYGLSLGIDSVELLLSAHWYHKHWSFWWVLPVATGSSHVVAGLSTVKRFGW